MINKKLGGPSMKCSSMVIVAALFSGDPGSHQDWFAVSNSNPKLRYQIMNITSL